MVFKSRKIPKHLIIREEYELRKKPRFGMFRFLLLFAVVAVMTWVVSIGMVQL